MVLPRILENLLETATRDSELKSWCIFQENNGDFTFKIKLGAPSSSANRVQPYAYRRKSHAQVMRDEARSKAWRSRQTEVRDVASAPLGNMEPSAVAADLSVAITSPDKMDTPHTPQSHPQAGPTTRSKAKIAEEIEQPRLDSVRTTPPAILDYSLLSPITNHGDSCHAMTTLGSSDTLLSPGSISSPVHECDTSTDSDAESSDMAYTCTSLRCEYGYCGHTPDADKEVHDAECMYWCRKCRYYLCCDCIDRGIHIRHRQLCEKLSIEEYDRLHSNNATL